MPFADTDAGRLRYREVVQGGYAPSLGQAERASPTGSSGLAGRGGSAGAGTPVVFVHGAGASSAVWIRVLTRAAHGRRAVALDLPGHGRSSGRFTSLEDARDAVGQLCAALGIQRAILVGHSMGGAVVLAAALAWPERVAGLGLCATAARFKVPAATLARVGSPGAGGWLSELGFSPHTPRDEVRKGVALAFDAEPEVRVRDFALLDGVDFRPQLAAVRAPTVVIAGADDLMLPPKLSAELAGGIAGAVLTEVPRAGHLVMLERPDQFQHALDPLLERVA